MQSKKTKKKNREDIKEIANNSREMFDYLLHVCNILIDPTSHEVQEREMNGLKRDLINTLQKIDSNNSKIMGLHQKQRQLTQLLFLKISCTLTKTE